MHDIYEVTVHAKTLCLKKIFKFAFFLVAEFVSSFSRLLDVELPIFGVVTVLFTMYAVYRKFARTPASFSIVLLETIFATRLSSS